MIIMLCCFQALIGHPKKFKIGDASPSPKKVDIVTFCAVK